MITVSLVDAHIHLTDKEFSLCIDMIITTLKAMGIKVCSVCVDNKTSLRSVELLSNPAHRNTIAQFIGIHPLYANREDVDKFGRILETNIQSIDGIGEIGLDRTYALNDYSPYPKQIEVFESMLRLAEKHQKPVSIHSRKSLDEILQLMSTYNITCVLMHWFSGNKKQLKECMDRGYYVSYGPTLLYCEDKRVLLRKTDKNRILTETDGPNKYSHCFRGYAALPSSFLTSVVMTVSEVLRMSYEEAQDMLTINWCQFVARSL
jgi:TatD DNase family protein